MSAPSREVAAAPVRVSGVDAHPSLLVKFWGSHAWGGHDLTPSVRQTDIVTTVDHPMQYCIASVGQKPIKNDGNEQK